MIDIDANSSGLPGIAQLRDIVGAVMTVGLFLSVPRADLFDLHNPDNSRGFPYVT
ncbi:hypothetical protein [Streptomyces sp. NPDC101249]|uniref:hypothetical protein n=1 Tax=Streptomyces sp. NPDC101249 TaxID=3366140 RepID=UPI00381B4B87